MSDLKELLLAISDHAGVYDVTERAYVLGRRRRTRRRAAYSGATAVFAVTALLAAVNLPLDRPAPEPAVTPSPSPSAVALSACTAAELPTPAGVRPDEFRMVAGDPTGRILASRGKDVKGGDIVAVWTDGVPTAVGKVSDLVVEVTAVSSTGAVVLFGQKLKDGSRGQTQYTALAWVYQDGKVTRLKGDEAFGAAVNAAGTVVGMVGKNPVTWRDATAEPKRLPVPAGMTAGVPMAIADDGSVVAPLYQGTNSRLHLWSPDGSRRPLTSPDTIDGAPVVESMVGRVADGWAAGTIVTQKGQARQWYAARWNLGTGAVEWFGGPGRPGPVNPQGWAVFGDTAALTLVHGDTAVVVTGLPGYTPGTNRTAMDRPVVSVISPDGRMLAGSQITLARQVPSHRVLRWTCR
ncbi:hypothetical protein [Catellatospora sichuanensis]|uniref:hypothetical protein n=1 Tax=Catellatospora sichuanensis TaxID=1969805 RepID=UPI00118347BD|nr:hypothetical protein [Catellatospora sichuanensis]